MHDAWVGVGGWVAACATPHTTTTRPDSLFTLFTHIAWPQALFLCPTKA